MAGGTGRVLARKLGDDVFFRICGHVTAHCCPAMRQFAEQKLAAGANRVFVELAECTYFDSTFLGTLLGLAKQPCLKSAGGLQLCAPSPQSLQILKQMSVQSYFPIAAEPAEPTLDDWQELPADIDARNTLPFKENVVRAHQELAAVPGPLSSRFQAIADVCRQELEGAPENSGD